MCSTFHDIRKSFASLRVEKKHRHRDIASFLNVTEVELIDSHVGVTKLEAIKSKPNLARAIRLKPSWSSIIHDLQGFGEVMSLTRNTHVVHENSAFYKNASLSDGLGMVLSDELVMHLIYCHWEHGYLFEECKSTVLQRSIQFFDEFGAPVHKVFLLPNSHHWYFDELAKRWADSNQDPGIIIQDRSELALKMSEGALTTILQERYANQSEVIDSDVALSLLRLAVQFKLPLIIIVKNDGVKQLRDGVVDEILDHKDWLHLMGEKFNCHLQLNQIPKICINHHEGPYAIEMLDDQDFLLASISMSAKATSADRDTWEDLLRQVKTKEMSFLE